MTRRSTALPALAAALLQAAWLPAALAQAPSAPAAAASIGLTYADLADLADPATVVARVQLRKVTRLSPEQRGAARPGTARVLVEARTRALLVGEPLGETVRYLADLPLDGRGRLPNLAKSEALIFARPVPGRAGELRLVAPDAQVRWSQPLEDRTRAVLAELLAPGAAPRVLAVREAMHVPGNLLGEGETQIFMATEGDAPVSVSVVSRPGSAVPVWGVSLSEIVDQSARPPARETLTWYRLACFLPYALSPSAILPGNERDRAKALEDYLYVRNKLGTCPRSRPPAYRPAPGGGAASVLAPGLRAP